MEKNPIFADSSFLIALFNSHDFLNEKAKEISREIGESGKTIVISNYIFLETMTVLSQKESRQVAVEAGLHLSENPFVEIVHIPEAIHNDSWRIFQAVKSKNISFIDCSVIAVMLAYGIDKLLTFDQDFKKLKKHYRFSVIG